MYFEILLHYVLIHGAKEVLEKEIVIVTSFQTNWKILVLKIDFKTD